MPETYDLIFDIVGATLLQPLPTIAQAPRCLSSKHHGVDYLVRILWTSIAGGKKLKGGVAMEHPERMNFIAELVAAGKLKAVIDRSYPLEQIAGGLQVR